ncbi:MAG TPA: phosphoesterase [Sulfuricurvum kujiense]|uniref:Phosphoesterase n=1 Tax=Sulfuricurvum kujiense TaxID=148813 RepID=A0A2D3WNI0_9BACT|nr:phosphatase PAP2 family protein [Sulfuricurvum kujiense]DAB39314.1 MAG TPA: phosphoesterase [Sulfuricurvum kujiense]
MVSAKSIFLVSGILIGTIALFGINGNIDTWVQNHFFNLQTHEWIIVRGERPWLDFILYDGIKKLLIFMYSILLISLLIAYKNKWIKHYRREIIILVLSGIFVPMTIVTLKTITNVPCPRDWQMYGGEYPHIGVFDSYPADFCQKSKIRCWPAGHASFGFSLLALIVIARTRQQRYTALVISLSIAWSMGWYKILKGDHFLSHTIIAMVMGWLIILLIVRRVDRYFPQENEAMRLKLDEKVNQ